MAIVNSIATTSAGFGSGQLVQRAGITLGSGTTVSLPASGAISPNIYRGKIRLKVYNGTGTNVALTAILFQITDGTNTVVIWEFNPSAAVSLTSTQYLDLEKDFLVDYGAGGGATGTLLGPASGAIVIQFTPTLSGSSPAATGDFEVVGEP
jgi:hypothetical protein